MLNLNMTFVATLVNFLLLVLILRAVLYRPIKNVIRERAETVERLRREAEEDRAAAAALRAEYEQRLAEARAEAASIEESAHQEADRKFDEIVARARDEARRAHDALREEVERERRRAWEELRHLVIDTAIDAASRVVERSLDSADNRRIVEEFLAEMESGGSDRQNA
ncbi:MAG: F0F1 ATP synthase subunit B [Firmicutes bacterium]|jgi:F-type H+-transporting ATPase subunit b|nr:F0F1 ATP synthase subunit B [Bacillota bacterium]